MGKILLAWPLLLACWLQLTYRSVHINLDRTSFFQNVRLVRKVSFHNLPNTLGFESGLFFTTMRLRNTFICHSYFKTFKEKKNKTSTCKFSMIKFTVQPIIYKIIMLLLIVLQQLQ